MVRLKFVFIYFIASIGFSQEMDMSYNENRIDENFIRDDQLTWKLNNHKADKQNLTVFVEVANDSLYNIYVRNESSDSLRISVQDRKLFLIQEAKSKNGKWYPVEYWRYSWCGNSYSSKNIVSNEIIKTESKAYTGNYLTEIRFKLLANSKTYYSNSIKGNVSEGQFKLSDSIKQRLEFNKRFIGETTASKVAFLEPDGFKEYAKKNKRWIKWVTKKAQKRNRKVNLK